MEEILYFKKVCESELYPSSEFSNSKTHSKQSLGKDSLTLPVYIVQHKKGPVLGSP